MQPVLVAIFVLAAALAAFFAARALFAGRKRAPLPPEAIILEEVVVTEPVAPGMEGAAELRKAGYRKLGLRIRATDPSQAYARLSTVRVIDYRDGCFFVEGADEEHLAR
jgi:hypothetical protein